MRQDRKLSPSEKREDEASTGGGNSKHPMHLFFEEQDRQEEIARQEQESNSGSSRNHDERRNKSRNSRCYSPNSAPPSAAVARAAGRLTSTDTRQPIEKTESLNWKDTAKTMLEGGINATNVGAYAVKGPRMAQDHEDASSIHQRTQAAIDHTEQVDSYESFLVEPATLAYEEKIFVSKADEMAETHTTFVEANFELVEAKIVPERPRRRKSVTYWVVGGGLAFLLVAVITIVAVFFSPSADESDTNVDLRDGLAKPADILYPPFDASLPVHLLTAIQDIGSPHYKANQWMHDDPNLHFYSPQRQQQRFHLSWVYFAFDGDNWHQNQYWLRYNISECEWFSRTAPQHNLYDSYPICDEDENLLKLNLAGNNLRGTIPMLLDFIPTLRVFNLGDNHIEGSPPAFTEMPNIEVEILSNNLLQGQLASNGEIHASQTRIIKLDGNQILGTCDPIYSLQRDLEIVDVTDNQFSGAIPTTVGYTTNLREWNFGNNQMSGTLPTELGLVTALEKLDAFNNRRVIGTIPSEMGLLTNLNLLNIAGTAITGTVPEELCMRHKSGALEILANCTLVECCA